MLVSMYPVPEPFNEPIPEDKVSNSCSFFVANRAFA
jgi:hypothetical protein